MAVNYKFPEIRTINDVLPHIQDRPEFIVAERDFGTVVNYMVAYSDSFDMSSPDDLTGAIRRECRGLIFDTEGKIMSRPFHKFFNLNERDETQQHLIALDMLSDHTIMEKMDGSMIRPVIMHDELRLATKMGVTDIAEDAEKLLTTKRYEWLLYMVKNGITPLFEYIAPWNKIVVDYKDADLVYLGSRMNISGKYFFDQQSAPFTLVTQYGTMFGDLTDYVSRARQKEGREGDIIRFADGHMIKLKNDWYVRIHKTKDLIQSNRNIAEIIINEKLDDIIPLLDATDLAKVKAYELRFNAAIENVLGRIDGLVTLARVLHGSNKKDVAVNFIPNLKYKDDAKCIFAAYDNKDIRAFVIDFIKKSVNNTTKYDELMQWMES